jgi:hypothetical protein
MPKMPKKKTKTPHEESEYVIIIEQVAGSALTYPELRDTARELFGHVTKKFRLIDTPGHDTLLPPNPPPRYKWIAFVQPHGHMKKFSKVVRQISGGHRRFRAEASRRS